MDITENYLYIYLLKNILKGSIMPNVKTRTDGRKSDGFVYILSGNCAYCTSDGDHFTASSGDLLYLADRAVYDMHIGSEETYSFIFCDFLFSGDKPRKSGVYKLDKSAGIGDVFKTLYNTFSKKNKGWHAQCLAYLYKIYAAVIAHAQSDYIGKNNKEKMASAKQYIQENENVTVEELSKKLGMSNVYFRKLFRASFGIAPSQYIIFQRIERAKALMEYSFLSLEECALQSGFSSVQYFSRAFKKVTGIPPATYRKNHNFHNSTHTW